MWIADESRDEPLAVSRIELDDEKAPIKFDEVNETVCPRSKKDVDFVQVSTENSAKKGPDQSTRETCRLAFWHKIWSRYYFSDL